MSSTLKVLPHHRPAEAERPEGWDELYLPTVKALINAGEAVADDLCRLASKQGLASKPMAICVWHLYQTGRVMSGDLARKCGSDAGNLSSMLDRLEEAGLVERESCNSDRRVRYVQLTAKGRKIGAAVQRDYKQSAIYTELNRLSTRERETFTNVLLNIVAAANR